MKHSDMNIIRSINFKRRTYYNPDHPIVIRKIINAGLGSIVQRMLNNGPWGIISVHSYVDELKDYLRQKGIGFIQMKGAWVDEEVGGREHRKGGQVDGVSNIEKGATV